MVNSGPLVNKTTHNRLVYTNPGPLGAALAVKKCFTVLWDCYNTFRTRRYLRSFGKNTVVLTSMAKTADYMAKYAQSDSKKGIGYIHEFHSGYNSTYRLDEEKTLRKVAASYDSFVALSEGDAKLFVHLAMSDAELRAEKSVLCRESLALSRPNMLFGIGRSFSNPSTVSSRCNEKLNIYTNAGSRLNLEPAFLISVDLSPAVRRVRASAFLARQSHPGAPAAAHREPPSRRNRSGRARSSARRASPAL